jgi:hypothetical protein
LYTSLNAFGKLHVIFLASSDGPIATAVTALFKSGSMNTVYDKFLSLHFSINCINEFSLSVDKNIK